VDDAVFDLRKDLDGGDHFDAIDKIAESVGTRQETIERFRLARTLLGWLTGFGSTVALVIVFAGVLGMAAVYYPFSRHMIRWPGVTLVVSGVSYLIAGWVISAFAGPWESAWCSFVDDSSCNLAIDVSSELLSVAAEAVTLPSIIATAVGIIGVVGAQFAPGHWRREDQEVDDNQQ
jgi:hypothetical protein